MSNHRVRRTRRNRQVKVRKKKRFDVTVGKVFAVSVIWFLIINPLIPDRSFSESENRMLQQLPSINFYNMISGSFSDHFETYLVDQFPGRSLLRGLRVRFDQFSGRREENGVFIGRGRQLMEDIVIPDQDALSMNIQSLKSFFDRYPEINHYMMLVPDAATIYHDKLPLFATVADQTRMFANVRNELEGSVQWIDLISPFLSHIGNRLYYQTDATWTSYGAFVAFQVAAPIMGIETDFTSSFASFPISTTFTGSLAPRTGREIRTREEIDIYVPRIGDNDMLVNYVDEQRRTTSLFDSSSLDGRDQKSVFLGGDTSVITINTMSESTRRLLVIRDSYGSNFIQFLTPFFREIIVVDPRFQTGSMDSIMDAYRITDVLVLYRGNSFFSDTNLQGVMQ